MSPKPRGGKGIREFLEYYVLEMLGEGPMSQEEMISVIERRSRDNERFRPGGSLRIDEREMEGVLRKLAQMGYVRSIEGGRLAITDAGREAFRGMGRIKREAKNSKEEATAKLISILLADAKGKAEGKYVLDVGTGEGYLAFKLAELGFNVLGIDSGEFDYSRDSISRAKEKARGNPRLEFRVADVKELEMEEAFDYVVSSQAVHCMRDQEGCIRSAYRLLKKGGLLLVSDFLVGLKAFLVHGFHSFLALSTEEWEEVISKCGYSSFEIHEVNDFCVVEARK